MCRRHPNLNHQMKSHGVENMQMTVFSSAVNGKFQKGRINLCLIIQ